MTWRRFLRHPLVIALVPTVFAFFLSVAAGWISDQVANRPTGVLVVADWDAPIVNDGDTFPYDEFKVVEAHKSDDPDYTNLIVFNEGDKPIHEISITLPYDADIVIMGTGESARTYRDIRNLPKFKLNPDESISVKIIDRIIPMSLSSRDIESHSSEGSIEFMFEMGIRPFGPFDPIYVVIFLAMIGVFSILASTWTESSNFNEIRRLKAKLAEREGLDDKSKSPE